MRAIQVRSTGGPEVLELRELPDPVPQAGEVLVRVHTAGVNFVDVYFREGKYKAPRPSFPAVRDRDMSKHWAEEATRVSE
jgi:NADPH:quinone reductase